MSTAAEPCGACQAARKGSGPGPGDGGGEPSGGLSPG
jgi:hypothetical protein